ncbi:MAG: hypothetical protein AB7O96_16325 [Pseudobdellovibrionaceae bacterium]
MKAIYPFVIFVLVSTNAYAAQSFNGVYCGKGKVFWGPKEFDATKVLEIYVTGSSLSIKRNEYVIWKGSTFGQDEMEAYIISGKVIYKNIELGTISKDQIHLKYRRYGIANVEQTMDSVGKDKISSLNAVHFVECEVLQRKTIHG